MRIEDILAESKKYEQLVLEHDPMYEDVVNVITEVKEYIRRKKLVIYGGTAIDFALRLKGDKIYPDESLSVADLDFFSPNSVEDAYELADIMYNKGYKEARAIVALHVVTMRVDIGDNHFIADLSYIPPDVYEKIPYLVYDGMRIVHPDFQKIDLHSALSFPYDDVPKEVIFNRWQKDIKRYNLMDKYYPTKLENSVGNPSSDHMKLRAITFPVSMLKSVVHGFAAYSLLCDWFRGQFGVLPEGSPASEFSIAGESFTCSVLDDFEIVHFNPDKYADDIGLEQRKKYEAYINLTPELLTGSVEGKGIRIHSTKGRLLSVNSIKLPQDSTNINIRVVNVQYLLKYMLSGALRNENKVKNTYLRCYISLKNMINECEKNILSKGPVTADTIKRLHNHPFMLSINTFGADNVSSSYEILINRVKAEIDGEELIYKPFNYYPGRSIPKGYEHPQFDYNKSHFFQENGREIVDKNNGATGGADLTEFNNNQVGIFVQQLGKDSPDYKSAIALGSVVGAIRMKMNLSDNQPTPVYTRQQAANTLMSLVGDMGENDIIDHIKYFLTYFDIAKNIQPWGVYNFSGTGAPLLIGLCSVYKSNPSITTPTNATDLLIGGANALGESPDNLRKLLSEAINKQGNNVIGIAKKISRELYPPPEEVKKNQNIRENSARYEFKKMLEQ